MYPLKAFLIGCKNRTLADLRSELNHLAIEIETEVLDVDAGVAWLAAHPGNGRLFIVEASSPAAIAQIERLSHAVAGQPILALVDSESDPSTLASCGASEFAHLPLQSGEIRGALQRAAVDFADSTSHCRTVLVLGATEGSGCTTMSVNLAFELARLQKRPCILGEQAVAFGRLANYLHINPPLTLYDLVSELDQLDAETMRQALFPVDEYLSVLVGSYLTIRPFTVTPEVAFKVLACTMELAETVVVDARHNFDDVDFAFASKVHHLVLVAKPTNPSLNNLRTLLETFTHFGRAGETYVVINQYEPGEEALSKETIERYLNVPHVWLVTADAAAVEAAENFGQTLRKAVPTSPAVEDITALARAILGIPSEQAAQHSGRKWLGLLTGD
jgi:Flp pilus assembly CpaE family ATPase